MHDELRPVLALVEGDDEAARTFFDGLARAVGRDDERADTWEEFAGRLTADSTIDSAAADRFLMAAVALDRPLALVGELVDDVDADTALRERAALWAETDGTGTATILELLLEVAPQAGAEWADFERYVRGTAEFRGVSAAADVFLADAEARGLEAAFAEHGVEVAGPTAGSDASEDHFRNFLVETTEHANSEPEAFRTWFVAQAEYYGMFDRGRAFLVLADEIGLSRAYQEHGVSWDAGPDDGAGSLTELREQLWEIDARLLEETPEWEQSIPPARRAELVEEVAREFAG